MERISISSLLGVMVVALLGVVVWSGANAQDTTTVTATVQAEEISISVADGSIDYGIISAGEKEDTTTDGIDATATGVNDLQTVTNEGNVAVDVDIQGQDASGTGSNDWTLSATAGTDAYVHRFCNNTDNDCTTDDTSYDDLTTSYKSLKTGVATASTVDFHLEIQTPTSSNDTDQKNADMTLRASAN
ncbi:MAG: hypothetical protein U5L75_00915 [Candidatus Campbellbacteria bacterium]|nr:hypothetical protein [Candidatus Campbellbacteria bacterium]